MRFVKSRQFRLKFELNTEVFVVTPCEELMLIIRTKGAGGYL